MGHDSRLQPHLRRRGRNRRNSKTNRKRLINAVNQRFEQQDQIQLQFERLSGEFERQHTQIQNLEIERDKLRLLIEQHRGEALYEAANLHSGPGKA